MLFTDIYISNNNTNKKTEHCCYYIKHNIICNTNNNLYTHTIVYKSQDDTNGILLTTNLLDTLMNICKDTIEYHCSVFTIHYIQLTSKLLKRFIKKNDKCLFVFIITIKFLKFDHVFYKNHLKCFILFIFCL